MAVTQYPWQRFAAKYIFIYRMRYKHHTISSHAEKELRDAYYDRLHLLLLIATVIVGIYLSAKSGSTAPLYLVILPFVAITQASKAQQHQHNLFSANNGGLGNLEPISMTLARITTNVIGKYYFYGVGCLERTLRNIFLVATSFYWAVKADIHALPKFMWRANNAAVTEDVLQASAGFVRTWFNENVQTSRFFCLDPRAKQPDETDKQYEKREAKRIFKGWRASVRRSQRTNNNSSRTRHSNRRAQGWGFDREVVNADVIKYNKACAYFLHHGCDVNAPGCDFNALNKTYRKLAMQLHPDKNRHDPEATAKFQELGAHFECICREKQWGSHTTAPKP